MAAQVIPPEELEELREAFAKIGKRIQPSCCHFRLASDREGLWRNAEAAGPQSKY